MGPEHFGVFPEDYDPDPEETLARYQPYIVALVKQGARRSSNFARPGQFDLQVDEMAQRVLIKFWQSLAAKHIEHHKAYLRTIVRNEFNDLSRKRKHRVEVKTVDWPADEADKKLLKASLSPARHKMVECLGLDPVIRKKKA